MLQFVLLESIHYRTMNLLGMSSQYSPRDPTGHFNYGKINYFLSYQLREASCYVI